MPAYTWNESTLEGATEGIRGNSTAVDRHDLRHACAVGATGVVTGAVAASTCFRAALLRRTTTI